MREGSTEAEITIKVKVPGGFQATGEYRPPKQGEYYLSGNWVTQCTLVVSKGPQVILEKISPRAEFGGSYWFVSGCGTVFEAKDPRSSDPEDHTNKRYAIGNYFLDKKDAEYVLSRFKRLLGGMK